jgi:uncharacterized protein involved in exopolysaccharide biosynthesis
VWIGDASMTESAARLRAQREALAKSRWFIVVWVLLWTGIGGAYVALVKPQFVSKVDIFLEPRRLANDGPEDLRHYHQLELDSEQADTELRVARSERVLRPVFDQFGLAKVDELRSGTDGFWPGLAHELHKLSPVATRYDLEARAFSAFTGRVRALRLGMSYVLEVSYRSQDPTRATAVANAVAAAFLADRLDRTRGEIERIGGAYSAIRSEALQSSIAKAQEAMAEGTAPAQEIIEADTRLLGAALPPLIKSYPRTGPTILFSTAFGLISGIFLVLFFRAPILVARRRR